MAHEKRRWLMKKIDRDYTRWSFNLLLTQGGCAGLRLRGSFLVVGRFEMPRARSLAPLVKARGFGMTAFGIRVTQTRCSSPACLY
jgi:hypothetical protein